MPDHFFFYGTLISQLAPPHLREILAESHLFGEGWIPGLLYDLGNYPGAGFDPASRTKVMGRVFQAPTRERLLAELDHYEGFNPASSATSQYLRKRLPITLRDDRQIECWVYEYNGSTAGLPAIAEGRWRAATLPDIRLSVASDYGKH